MMSVDSFTLVNFEPLSTDLPTIHPHHSPPTCSPPPPVHVQFFITPLFTHLPPLTLSLSLPSLRPFHSPFLSSAAGSSVGRCDASGEGCSIDRCHSLRQRGVFLSSAQPPKCQPVLRQYFIFVDHEETLLIKFSQLHATGR